MRRLTGSAKKQQGTGGVAIIAALLVVSVVATIAVKQSWRADIDLTRSGHRWLGMQAKAYVDGAESLALIALDRDRQDNEVDSADELWASGFDFPTDHGDMRIEIVDAQSKLNINALAVDFIRDQNTQQPLAGAAKYSATQKRFIRLLQTIPVEEDAYIDVTEAEAILEAVKDWLDANDNPEGFGGAERNYYEQLEPPVTIANASMVSVSELRLIKGMRPELYRGLLPLITVLPAGAKLNINTMPLSIARSLNTPTTLAPLTVEQGQELVAEIAANIPQELGDYESLPILPTIFGSNQQGGPDIQVDELTVETNYFELNTTVTVGEHVRRGKSLIERIQKSRVVRRSDANL